MAKTMAERSGPRNWLYRLGYASGRIEDALRSVREAAAGGTPAAPAADRAGADAAAGEGSAPPEPLRAFVATAALGTLAAQLLHPRRVNWPRAVLAGTIGTLMYDVETVAEARRLGRKFGTREALRRILMAGDLSTQAGRLAAGVGMAGFYAGFLHGRLPGPPLLQGLLYGALESGAHGWGGAAALLGRLSPEVHVPAAYARGIARGNETALERVRRHLVFGLVLGLVYRDR